MIPLCNKCPLAERRYRMVIGRGRAPASILFLGEAPGRSEDLLGEPFVGPSGRILDELLTDAGLSDSSYFITNAVLCRPCDARGAENRQPTPTEVLACKENVLRLAEIVSASSVVFLGKIAERYYRKHFPAAITILHPAFLLRTGGKRSPHYLGQVRKLEVLHDGDEA